MTEEQIVKKESKQHPGVILTERFVKRNVESSVDNWFFLAEPDEIISRLAEHFAINQDELVTLPLDGATSNEMLDDMPRFQQSLRDGLQVPKEGNDGTGN